MERCILIKNLIKFLGITDLPSTTQQFIIKTLFLQSLVMFGFQMGMTFIILDYIDEFGFFISGSLMAVAFLIQFVSDYPTGSLGDYIGQKYIIAISLFFFSLSYLIIAIFSNLILYIFSAMFFGIGMGQISGSFESYIDNNYKLLVKGLDEDRKIYGFAFQRYNSLIKFISLLAFIIGGIFSTVFFRKFVFFTVSIILFLLIPIILVFLTSFTKKNPLKIKSNKKGYFYFLNNGLRYFISSKQTFSLIFGISMNILASNLWALLLLFPIYFGYTGSDAGVSLLRTLIYVAGMFNQILLAKYSQNLNTSSFGKIASLYHFLWFTSFAVLLIIVPLTNSLNVVGTVMCLLLMTLTINGIGVFNYSLLQRLLSLTIPSETRNSVYSLIPTVAIFFQIPFLMILGVIVENFGIIAGLFIPLGISLFGCGFLIYFHYLQNVAKVLQQTQNQFKEPTIYGA